MAEVKTNTRIVKLKITPVGENTADNWKRIKEIANATWKGANWAVGGQYLTDQLMERLYARKKIKPLEDPEGRDKCESDLREFMGTKRQAMSERDMKDKFPEIPPCVSNPMNQNLYKNYAANKPNVKSGNRTLATYKKGMPFDITASSINFEEKDKNHFITWLVSRNEPKIKFKIYYGQDRANIKLSVQRIIDGEYKKGSSKLQLKDGTLYLLLTVQQPVKDIALNPDIHVGVDLGLAIPAYLSLNEGSPRKAIGSEFELTRHRTQIAKRKRAIQKSCIIAKGQHGRNRKMKGYYKLASLERNFVKTYNHTISKQVIDFALANNAGVIKMELLEGIARDEKSQFVLRNWSYFELQTMIEYKAKSQGIAVLYVDPYMTSQTCSKCGNLEPGQRISQSVFKCKKCEKQMNADYNASKNIAKSDKVVTSKDECHQVMINKAHQSKKDLLISSKKYTTGNRIKAWAKILGGEKKLDKAKRMCKTYSESITLLKQDETWNGTDEELLNNSKNSFEQAAESASLKTLHKRVEWLVPQPDGEVA